MTALVACHAFADTPHGRACHCGRRWADIAGATEADLGKPHVAHVGCLNATELATIVAERERVWQAVLEACGAGRPGAAP